ncbi:ABC transporter substrate-binding protein [Vibrio sonorensis]|uniref:ABC transporter substrate-binding protein n=1 Tax=Vibrio sonorensis TaxID=1004316 RepID=UPI0008D93EE2|nr:ABC transporter substrate-binding protein [Vibrio sonorensis]
MIRGALLALIASFSLSASDKVVLLELDWASQRVLTHALHQLFQTAGVESEILTAPSNGQWFYLTSGAADVQVEIWQGTMEHKFSQLVEAGKLEQATVHNATTREDWWYPEYVETLCPGLPDWKALRYCAAIFADGGTKGIYYSGPWEKPDMARIRALKLPFRVETLSSGDEINQMLINAINNKAPILIFNWSPNWVEETYAGKFVEFPPYEQACESNSLWGINPSLPWDCGNPSGGWLKVAKSTHLNKKSQCAADITSAFSLSNQEIAYAAYLLDVQQYSLPYAAQKWLEKYQSKISGWIKHSSCELTTDRNS